MEVLANLKPQKLSPQDCMRLAIATARKALGTVSPNPPVGCVIVNREHRLLAVGFTQPPGHDHAEINAIKNLAQASSLKGAHLYVTLEPCAHHGRTPSCAQALAQLPIASVTYGLLDPNPLVNGKGVAILANAGIKVQQMAGFQVELQRLAEIFLHNQRHRLPFVALKVATSLDGYMGLKSGESQWITSERARRHAHYLRGLYDAILVGAGTFLTDDPLLNVRHGPLRGKALKVVLLDPQAKTLARLAQSRLLQNHLADEVFVVIDRKVTGVNADTGTRLIPVDYDNRSKSFDLTSMLQALFEQGICSIFVEGGASTHAIFLQQRIAQRLYQYIAPQIIGGNGLGYSNNFHIEKLAEKIQLSQPFIKKLNPDLLVSGRLVSGRLDN